MFYSRGTGGRLLRFMDFYIIFVSNSLDVAERLTDQAVKARLRETAWEDGGMCGGGRFKDGHQSV